MADQRFSGGFSDDRPFGVPGMYASAPSYGTIEPPTQEKSLSFIEYQKKDKARRQGEKKLWQSTIFCFLFMCAEIAGGYLSNSLAIMTDAAHLLSDLSAFAVSIFSMRMARKAKTKRMSFGSHRSEVLGMLISILIIWILTIWLVDEAFQRVYIVVSGGKLRVDGKLMTIVAAAGIVVNVSMFAILGHSHGGEECGGHSHDGGGGHSHDDAPKAASGSGGHSHGGHGGGGHSHDDASKACGGHSHDDASKAASGSGGHSHGGHGGGSGGHSHSHDDAPKASGGHSHGGHGGGGHSHGGHGSGGTSDAPKFLSMEWFINKATGGASEEGNVRAALIHVIGDLLQSIGVLIAAIIVWIFPTWVIVDPLCTFLFSILVLFTTVNTFKEGTFILLESVPTNITEPELIREIKKVKGVVDVHDLHCWLIAKGVPMFIAHIKPRDNVTTAAQCYQMIDEIRTIMYTKYKIVHCTIEFDNDFLVSRQLCFFQFGDKTRAELEASA